MITQGMPKSQKMKNFSGQLVKVNDAYIKASGYTGAVERRVRDYQFRVIRQEGVLVHVARQRRNSIRYECYNQKFLEVL